jgi:hypothetical protein
LIFCLGDLSVSDRGALKSSTTILLESICAFKSFRVGLMTLCALTLGACRWIIIISFWFIYPFISMKCLSLSHLVNVSLKSSLSDINIDSPACFLRAVGLVNLLPAFNPS